MKKKIALLFGGAGHEHEISCRSAAAVLCALDKKLFAPIPIGIAESGGWFFLPADPEAIENGNVFDKTPHPVPTFPVRLGDRRGFLSRRKLLSVDAALPILHGDFGEDGTVAGALSLAGIPFVGCDTVSGAIAADKAAAKALAASLGIPTLPFVIADGIPAEEAKELAEAKLSYPMFVKPARLGSSVGASPADTPEDFLPAFRAASSAGGGRVLIEPRLLSFSEIECAYFSAGSLPIVTAPGEITTGGGFYSYAEKYGGESSARVTASSSLGKETADSVSAMAAKLVRALGVRDLCRVDFFLSQGEIYFNEINTLPGMTGASLYPALLSRLGLSFTEVLTRLLLQAMRRGG